MLAVGPFNSTQTRIQHVLNTEPCKTHNLYRSTYLLFIIFIIDKFKGSFSPTYLFPVVFSTATQAQAS